MINTGAYDYINVLNKAANASWQRQEAISNNIANVGTPGYKRQDVNFESALATELKKSQYTSLDKKVSNISLNRLNVNKYTDAQAENFSYRIDNNNVDIDTENVELASNSIKYDALSDSIVQEFSRIKLVLT